MGTYQHILALQDIMLYVIDYLIIIFLVIVVTVSFLTSLPRQQFLLPLLPLVLLGLPLSLGLGAVHRPHKRIPRQWSWVIPEDEVPRLVPQSQCQY